MLRVRLATCWSQVRRPHHYTTKPHIAMRVCVCVIHCWWYCALRVRVATTTWSIQTCSTPCGSFQSLSCQSATVTSFRTRTVVEPLQSAPELWYSIMSYRDCNVSQACNAQNPLYTFSRNFPVGGKLPAKLTFASQQTQRTFTRENLLQTCCGRYGETGVTDVGHKRDVEVRDRDETETFDFQSGDETETETYLPLPRSRPETETFDFGSETRPSRW